MVRQGHRAVMVYLVQRADARRFTFARDLDPTYAAAFTAAHAAGVEAIALRCRLSPEQIAVDREIPIRARSSTGREGSAVPQRMSGGAPKLVRMPALTCSSMASARRSARQP